MAKERDFLFPYIYDFYGLQINPLRPRGISNFLRFFNKNCR